MKDDDFEFKSTEELKKEYEKWVLRLRIVIGILLAFAMTILLCLIAL